jgi:hypothetical protein
MNAETTTFEGDINRLRARRRQVLPTDEFVTDYDGVDEAGHKYRELTIPGEGGTTQTIQSDLTAMYQAAPSMTGDVDLLVIEAELLADGTDLENPHLPATTDVRDRAHRRIEQNGHTPAWNHRL